MRLWQPKKARSSMASNNVSRTTEVRLLQPMKVVAYILVMIGGKVIDMRL